MRTASAILELQQVDLNILRDRKTLNEIPEMEQIQQVRSKLKELARRTTKIVGELKDQRIEHEDNEGRRRTLSRHVEEINLENSECDDFRRVQANNAELDRLAKRLEKVDYNQHVVEQEIARLEGLQDQAMKIRETLEAREAELVESFKEKATNIKQDLETLVRRREALTEQMSEDMYRTYMKSCEGHNHVGVARLEGHACTGCRVELQQSQIDTLRRGPAISSCPVCGRIIVVREEDDEV